MKFKPYPKYKASGVEWLGEVPSEWQVSRLKRVAESFPSNVDKKSVEGEEQVLLCNYTDVYYNEQITSGMEFMRATATAAQIDRFTLREGDVIITKDSETADDIGRSAYVPQNLPGIVCGYHLSMIRVGTAANGRYIKKLFESHFLRASLEVSAQGLTRVGLGQYQIDNLILPLPPIEDQEQIALYLDRETAKLDTLIAKQEKLIELLQEKRQAMISHAVTKGLDPSVPMKDSGIEWLGKVPEHWDVKQLRHIAMVVRGASPRPAGDPIYFSSESEGNVPWVTVAEVTKDANPYLTYVREYLTPLGANQSQQFNRDTLILTNSGATLGVPKILKLDCCANDGILAFRYPEASSNILYMYYFLLTQTERLRTEMKQGGGQPNLNTNIVKDIWVPQPPLNTQLEIVNYLTLQTEKLDSLIVKAMSFIELMREHRTALISAAVIGKIDVREAA